MKATLVSPNIAIRFALVAIVASAGCSVVLAKPAPARVDRGSYPECGTPSGALVTDILLGVVGGLFLVSAMDDGDGDLVAGGTAVTGLYLGSAIYGGVVQNKCQDARVAAAAGLSIEPLRAQLAPDVPAAAAPQPDAPPAAPTASPSAPVAPVGPAGSATPLPSIPSRHQ